MAGRSNEAHPVATVIGDVVGSRAVANRRDLHERLIAATKEAEAVVESLTPMRLTVGDEFQGAYATVGAALAVLLPIRLSLLPDYDVRFGVGYGPVSLLSTEPWVEDGPGWWAAREAIDGVQATMASASRRLSRSAFRCVPGVEGPNEAAVNAALLARDELVGRLDSRSLAVLRGLRAGETQRQLAQQAGVSASAVSQRVRNDGLDVILAVDELLGAV